MPTYSPPTTPIAGMLPGNRVPHAADLLPALVAGADAADACTLGALLTCSYPGGTTQ